MESNRIKRFLRSLRISNRNFSFSVRRYLTKKIRQDLIVLHDQSLREVQRTSDEVLKELQTIGGRLERALHESRAEIAELRTRIDRIENYSLVSAQRVAITCGHGEILVRTAVGFVLCSVDDHAVLAQLLEVGELEPGTRRLIERLVGPGDLYIDVGAHLGLHVLAAARAMKGHGKIIAFEPYGPTKSLLEKSVWVNGFSEITEIHQAAASARGGEQKLYLGTASSLHSLFSLEDPLGLSQSSIDVPVVRLCDVVKQGQSVKLLKIDAEGAEIDVLMGAESIIRNNPNIALVVEFGPSHLRRTAQSTERWFSAYANLGLVYRVINPSTGALEDWTQGQLERVNSANLLFARPECVAWASAETLA
jgi:FkbM family methyltransferase